MIHRRSGYFLNYLKPFSFLPAILIMCIIFSFSSQNGTESGSLSHTISVKVVETIDFITISNWSDDKIEICAAKIEPPIRKLAHMTEYCSFTLSVMFPLYIYKLRGKRLFLITLVFCICFAASDEFHQSFVVGRGPSIRDVFIDGIGVLIGTGIWKFLTFLSFKPIIIAGSEKEHYDRKIQKNYRRNVS